MKEKNYYPSIDGIRALAVLAVIFFHLELTFFSGGYVGVDMFFVISGYLITRNIWLALNAKTFCILTFYTARIRRLVPALLATVIISLLVGVLLYSPDALIRLSGSVIAGVLSLANIRFWANSGYFDTDSISKPLLHLWSLSVEEQFYLFWPILLLVCFLYLTTRKQVTSVLLILIIGSFTASVIYLESSTSLVFYWMPFRAYEFGIGGLFAYFELVKRSASRTRLLGFSWLTLLGVILVLIAILLFDERTPFPGFYSLIPCLGTLCLIISRDSLFSKTLLANDVMIKLGKISYSLYLVHWPIWVYISFWVVSPLTVIQKTGVFFLILIFGWLMYVFVERRYRYSTTDPRDKSFFIGILAVAILVLASAYMFRINSGFPQRISNNSSILGFKEGALCEYPNGDKSLKICDIGDLTRPEKSVLLVGDSHAMNLAKGLDAFGETHHIRIHSYSVAGCAPLLGVKVYKESAHHAIKNCTKFSQELKNLLQDERFDAVIISARWGWYFEHEPYFDGQKTPIGFLSDVESKELSTTESKKVWLRSITKTINFARDNRKRVILLSQYPLLHKGIGECDKSPNLAISRDQVALRCKSQIPYALIMQRLSFMNSVILSLKNNEVLSVLPSDYFCDREKKTCNVLTDDGLLYADENHLSPLGSIALIESIQSKLRDFIFGRVE